MEELTFEEAYTQLEAAVVALQDRQLSLERALEYYEKGMRLAHYCDELLQKAELRVQQLSLDDDGIPVTHPFEIE